MAYVVPFYATLHYIQIIKKIEGKCAIKQTEKKSIKRRSGKYFVALAVVVKAFNETTTIEDTNSLSVILCSSLIYDSNV